MKFYHPIIAISIILLTAACGSSSSEIHFVEYRFEDAAKAPEDRRDYTIEMAPDAATAEITNGDSLLAVGHFTMYPGQMDSVREASSRIMNLDQAYLTQDCGGCNYQTITLMDSTRNVIKMVEWNGGMAPTDLLLFKEKMMHHLGNFNVLLQSTMHQPDSIDQTHTLQR